MPFNSSDIGIEVGFLGMSSYMSQLALFGRKSTDTFGGVKKSVGGTKSAWSQFAAEVPGLGRAMSLVQNPITGVTVAITALGTAMVKSISEASQFSNQFLELQNLNLDKTGDQLIGLRDDILSTAVNTGQAAKDISQAFFDVQSGTGKFGEEVEEVVTQVANFSTATKTDLSEAVNGAVKGLRAYRFEVGELDSFLASSFATVQVGITTFNELSKVSVEFAGAAAAVGQSYDQANKVFASFTATAKNTQIAATLTKAAFQDLGKESTVKGLKKYKINVFDPLTGSMRKVEDIIRDMVPKFGELNDQEFAELKDAIGGSEGLRGLLDAVKNGGEDLIEVFEGFDQAKEAFDIEKLLANAKGDFKTLTDIVQNQFNTVISAELRRCGEGAVGIRRRLCDSDQSHCPL